MKEFFDVESLIQSAENNDGNTITDMTDNVTNNSEDGIVNDEENNAQDSSVDNVEGNVQEDVTNDTVDIRDIEGIQGNGSETEGISEELKGKDEQVDDKEGNADGQRPLENPFGIGNYKDEEDEKSESEKDEDEDEDEEDETEQTVGTPSFLDTISSSPILLIGAGVVGTLLVLGLILLVKKLFSKPEEVVEPEIVKETPQPSQSSQPPQMYVHTIPREEKAVVKETTVKKVIDIAANPLQVAQVCGLGAREEQQDAFGFTDSSDLALYRRKGMLAIVADGMGGLSNGGDVSSLVVRTCLKTFNNMSDTMASEDMLTEMARESNRAVNQLLRDGQRSGSTLVAALVRDSYLHFLTIGDSHIYLYRNGALIQLNREHIYREELTVRAVNGNVSIERANQDKQSKSLTSYLGIGKVPHVDRNQEGIRLVKGDRLLLASDGVFGTLSVEQLEAVLAQPADTAVSRIRDLVEKAGRKYQDNYTAVVLEYKG